MYVKRPLDDFKRFAKAVCTNQIARFAPAAYVKLTRQTGRGSNEGDPASVAYYFRSCFDEYFHVLGVESSSIKDFLKGKEILEYGPGDTPGVALLLYAYGAKKVICVDRFPLVSLSERNKQILYAVLDSCDDDIRARGEEALLQLISGASAGEINAIEYMVTPSGLSGIVDVVDLVISRAVLEHVNDLEATFLDIRRALRKDGIAIHQVDLKSHGLHRDNPLDFLVWPRWAWSVMYSQKGVPNRWRVNKYRQVITEAKFEIKHIYPTETVGDDVIDEIRPFLAFEFKEITSDELAWLGFWLVLTKTS